MLEGEARSFICGHAISKHGMAMARTCFANAWHWSNKSWPDCRALKRAAQDIAQDQTTVGIALPSDTCTSMVYKSCSCIGSPSMAGRASRVASSPWRHRNLWCTCIQGARWEMITPLLSWNLTVPWEGKDNTPSTVEALRDVWNTTWIKHSTFHVRILLGVCKTNEFLLALPVFDKTFHHNCIVVKVSKMPQKWLRRMMLLADQLVIDWAGPPARLQLLPNSLRWRWREIG